MSTWELIEGVKNASSLCLTWYGPTKIERKMLRYEYQQKLLIRHRHLNIHKELSYFREKPEVPNDLIEIAQQLTVPTPPASLTKKEVNKSSAGLHLNLSLNSNQMGLNDSVNLCSPSTVFPNTPTSADVVIIGSNIGANMTQNPVLMNRLQSIPGNAQIPPVKGQNNRGLATPDKQQRASSAGAAPVNSGGNSSTKKRSTTPRAKANVRGASANAAAMASGQITQPNLIPHLTQQQPIPQLPQQPQPQQQQINKLVPQQQSSVQMPQQQQIQQQQQRSTNSPMLAPGQAPFHMQAPNVYNQQSINRPMTMPVNNPIIQGNQTQARPGINGVYQGQMMGQMGSQSTQLGFASKPQTNPAQRVMMSNQTQQQPIQPPPPQQQQQQAPQPISQPPQQNRMFAPNSATPPLQQPPTSTTPTLQSQLNQPQPNLQTMDQLQRRKLQQQQQQQMLSSQKPAQTQMFSQNQQIPMQQQQQQSQNQGRMMPGVAPTQNFINNVQKQQQRTSTTPDPVLMMQTNNNGNNQPNMMQQKPVQAQQAFNNQNYMARMQQGQVPAQQATQPNRMQFTNPQTQQQQQPQPQQQQQQQMPLSQTNGQPMIGQQNMAWQQQQQQQRQNMQRAAGQQPTQQQQYQMQQQQQFLQKQQVIFS